MPSPRRNGYDVVVIGGGVAGLTGLWHAAQYGLSAALLEPAPLFGGQVATVTVLEGFPAAGPLSGSQLASTLLQRALDDDAVLVEAAAESIRRIGGAFEVVTATQAIRGRALVVATGLRPRLLGVPGEAALTGRGVSHCASCDGPLFRGEDVVVVGGGDSALQEAALLAPLCRSVTLVVRNRLSARRKFIDRIKAQRNVRFIWDCVVDEVLGDTGVTAVRLRNQDSGALAEIPCAGIFAYIGGEADTGFLPPSMARDAGGRLVTDGGFATSERGVYAVGAIRSGFSGELVSAAGEGAGVIRTLAARLA